MTLVPIEVAEGGESTVEGRATVKVNPYKQQLIGVSFDTARVSDLSMKIRTVGRLAYDETKIVKVHTRISGWVERLHVDYTGKEVNKGDPLFSIYSPQLYSTQEEYLLALKGERLLANSSMTGVLDNAQSLSGATKRRLKLWDITDEQIKRLEKSGKAEEYLEIVSPINGFVTEKNVFAGRYVNPGDILYTIADLEKIWALADIYEYELPHVRVGQEAKITLSYFPGEEFTGAVTYVYPYLNDNTRTALVRFEINNPDFKLKPDMYVNVQIEIDLGKRLTIPRDAILFSGERRIAYVKNGDTTFEPREIKTGVQAAQIVEVLEGIEEGEMVVTSANFLIDSESQLRAAVMSMIGGHSDH
jgi:RND family efflux transporter MFP subunit